MGFILGFVAHATVHFRLKDLSELVTVLSWFSTTSIRSLRVPRMSKGQGKGRRGGASVTVHCGHNLQWNVSSMICQGQWWLAHSLLLSMWWPSPPTTLQWCLPPQQGPRGTRRALAIPPDYTGPSRSPHVSSQSQEACLSLGWHSPRPHLVVHWHRLRAQHCCYNLRAHYLLSLLGPRMGFSLFWCAGSQGGAKLCNTLSELVLLRASAWNYQCYSMQDLVSSPVPMPHPLACTPRPSSWPTSANSGYYHSTRVSVVP